MAALTKTDYGVILTYRPLESTSELRALSWLSHSYNMASAHCLSQGPIDAKQL